MTPAIIAALGIAALIIMAGVLIAVCAHAYHEHMDFIRGDDE